MPDLSLPGAAAPAPAAEGLRRMLADAERRHVPLEVSLELTHRCVFRCVHCYIPDFSAPDLLTTARLLTLLDELAEAGTLFLTLTGGEVLLRPDWEAVARRARELRFALTVLTNGFLLDEAAADALAALRASVHVSVYSLEPERMDRITGREGATARALSGAALARERGLDVVVKTPVLSVNRGDVAAVSDWARSIGAGFRSYPSIVARKDGDRAPLAFRVPDEELRDLLPALLADCGERRDAVTTPGGPVCSAGSRFCSISTTGDVWACNILPGSAGNVREQTFREVWEGSAWLRRIRSIRLSDLDVCGRCDARVVCARCPGQALLEDGDLLGPSSAACRRAEVLSRVRGRPAAEDAAGTA